MENNHKQCQYLGPDNEHCFHDSENNGFCYWHDQSRIKTETDLIERLEKRAQTGEPMVGFSLRRTNLHGINLVNHDHKNGFKLIHSDLYRSDLRNAHLFHLDMTGSSLMKANLSHANLNCALLIKTNLLGLELKSTKMENTLWDEQVIQEDQAYTSTDNSERLDLFEQAEEIYRNLRRTNESQGLFELAGHFFKREMIMRRYQLPCHSTKRFLSKLVDLFCGYGEEPSRVIIFSLLTTLSFALLFFLFGITDGSTTIQLSFANTWLENVQNFFYSLYFSVVTFTTLGYGDLAPFGLTRAFAALEAFLGSFTLALFVVVFVKKMTR